MSNNYGYIQIYTVDKNILEPNGLRTIVDWNILITPNKELLKNEINNNSDLVLIKNINIKDTFRIEFDKIYCIFKHARDRILKGYIKDKNLVIYGDHELIKLIEKLPVLYEFDSVDIILKANNDFLEKYGLPPLTIKSPCYKYIINNGLN